MGLAVGDKAPAFEGLNQEGEKVTLNDFKGKKLVLYFYPKDMTPACTNQACSLRDDYTNLTKKGYAIVGVSADTVKKHRNFADKYELPFDLIADTELSIINAYGVWGLKKFMGREFDGIIRTTFIIDEKGKIEQIISKVDTKEHAAQILGSSSR
jgi:peroxiredoxin Q/BCP